MSYDKKEGLPHRQEIFCREYIISLNATKAAEKAGYSLKTAYSQGQRLLKNVEIKKMIDKYKKDRIEDTKIDAAYVLKRLKEIDEMDAADILDEQGNILPVKQWPEVWRKSLSGLDIVTLGSGDTEQIVKKIKWPDKIKNLELMGKHVNIQAFSDKVDLSSTDGTMTPISSKEELRQQLKELGYETRSGQLSARVRSDSDS
jgi:phage terminase small subunit